MIARRGHRSTWAAAVAALSLVASACTGDAVREIEPTTGRGPEGRALRFVDVASDVGLDFRHGAFRWDVTPDPVATMGTGLCWLDAEGDGDLDLFAVNSWALAETQRWESHGGVPTSALYLQEDGRFAVAGEGSGTALAIRGSGCVAADLDLDGHTDLYVTGERQASLLWNDGDGTFAEGAAAAGVEAFGWHTGAAVSDVNGDGWPDLFVAGYADLAARIPEATLGFPNTYRGVRDLLYLSDGAGGDGRPTFREVGGETGLELVDPEYGLGAVFSDLDRDGDADLYVANDTKPNRLYENVAWPGGASADPLGLGFRFEELAGSAGVADPNAGMGVAAADHDGDGRTDLFVTNAREQGHAVFRQITSEAATPAFADGRLDFGPPLDGSTGWGVSWADLDNDTDLDLAYVNGAVPVRDLLADAEPLSLLGNLTAQGLAGRYEDLAAATGVEDLGPLLARGSAAADYDTDGDVDLAIALVGGPLVLLQNQGTQGRWLEVRLDRFDPGAVVEVTLPDGRTLVREVAVGSSYLSSEDPVIHVGLGAVDRVERVVVRWTDGGSTVVDDVGIDHVLVVGEDP